MHKIAVIKGDGIGPDIVDATLKVMDCVSKKFDVTFEYEEVLAGGAAYDAVGNPLPDNTLEVCKRSDAVLLGAVGGPKWDHLSGNLRPEAALLGLRKGLGLYANIRPAKLHGPLKDACPLKPELIGEDGFDLVVVRELTGGIYFGERGASVESGVAKAYDTLSYDENEIRRIAHNAFSVAQKRRKKVTSVDKANILESSRLWRRVVEEVAKQYPEVELEHMYVDNAAMQILRYPKQFDVILTTNMFGDILSDEASMLTGSIGMLPSASLGEGTSGMYEPIHGSAPDIAGQNIANPIATVLSAAMMLRYSLNLTQEADAIEAAVSKVLEEGYRTKDISSSEDSLGTEAITAIICEKIME